MATTSSVLNRLRNSIGNAVSSIGATNGTRRPSTDTADNRQGVAYELAVSEMISKRANARYRAAVKEAIDAEIMFDHKSKPILQGGIVRELYSDDIVTVTVRTTEPHSRLNAQKLRDLLVKQGMSFNEVAALFTLATDKTKPPHEFTADIIPKQEQ